MKRITVDILGYYYFWRQLSILCFHYLWEGLKNSEKCLYITSDENIENINKQANELGFNFKPWVEKNGIKYKIFGYKGKQVRDQIHSIDVVNAMDEFYRNPTNYSEPRRVEIGASIFF